jgi:hypothetical protein
VTFVPERTWCPDKDVLIAVAITDIVPSCKQIDALLTQFEKSSQLCDYSPQVNLHLRM